MGTQIQWRGGTSVEHKTFTGANREITIDTTKKIAVVHDGQSPGGFPIAREDLENVEKETLLNKLDYKTLFSLIMPTGMSFDWWGRIAPSGFLLLRGQTIGSDNSNADLRGDIYKALFIFLWDNIENEYCPVSDGRSIVAVEDWKLNKTLQIPDARRKCFIGSDSGDFKTDRLVGSSGGEEKHLLATNEIPKHSHLLVSSAGRQNLSSENHIRRSTSVAEGGLNNENFEYTLQGTYDDPHLGKSQTIGGDEPHNNMQPYIVVNKIIKL